MDSLKSLLEKGQYELVLSLSENASDAASLFCRVSAYLATNRPQEAQAILLAQRDLLFAANPTLLLKSDFELRFILNQYDEAYEDLAYFNEKPYVSQAVEEYLRALPGAIRTNERNHDLSKQRSPEEIVSLLRDSKDDYEVLAVLSSLQGISAGAYLPSLVEVLSSPRHPSVRTYALLLLISQKYPKKVTFAKNGKTYALVPADLVPPYTGKAYQDFLALLAEKAPDPSFRGVARRLLDDAILARYPEPLITPENALPLSEALLSLAEDYLRSGKGEASLSPEARALKNALAETLRAEPPLAI